MNRLTAILLTLILATPSNAALTRFWKLNDNAASTTIVATTGSNAALEGGDNTSVKATAVSGLGQITAALDLNGTDDVIAASFSFASGSAFTFSGWLYGDGTNQILVGGTGNVGYARRASNTTLSVKGTSTIRTYTVSSIAAGAWHHWVITRDTSNNVRVFVDGVESSTGSQTLAETFAPTHLGRNGIFHDGKMAWVKIYDSDESANVAALYAEGTGVINPLSSSIPGNAFDPMRGL